MPLGPFARSSIQRHQPATSAGTWPYCRWRTAGLVGPHSFSNAQSPIRLRNNRISQPAEHGGPRVEEPEGAATKRIIVAARAEHLLAIKVEIVPLTEAQNVDLTWYVGLDAQGTRRS